MAKQPDNTGKPAPKVNREKLEKYGAALVEHYIRFTAIANAGGVVATITVLGATAKAGDIANILALPLALFATGVICALLTTFQTLNITVAKMVKPKPERFKIFQWIRPWMDEYHDFFEYGGPICFIAGTVVGVLIVAFV